MSKKEMLNLSNAMADAVENGGKYSVMVNARRRLPASGIALSKDLILTANHVLEKDEGIQVFLPDGTKVTAKVAGRDYGSDLAVLKLEDAKATPMIQNGDPRVGQLVMALGRPSKAGIQASLGIISAIGGKVRGRRGGMLDKHMRTDAIPYPGFSGGPLIDSEGKVLGINTSGLGFSNSVVIPIDVASKIAESLEKHGSIKRGYLGISSQVVDLPKNIKLEREQKKGLLIANIVEDSPAANAGLMTGDILIGFNDLAIEDHESLFAAMSGEVVGQEAPIEFLRGGELQMKSITLSQRKDSDGRKHFRRRASRHHGRGRNMRGKRILAHKMKGHGRGRHFDPHHDDHDDEDMSDE